MAANLIVAVKPE